MNNLVNFGVNIPVAIYIPILYFLWVSVFIILKRVVFGKIHKFVQKSKTNLDNVLIKALDLPLSLLIFVSGLFVLENIFQFGMDGEILQWVDVAFKATGIIAVIIFFDRLLRGLINNYSDSNKVLKDSSTMLNISVRVVVMGLGLLIVLDSCGVSITPILASLGIGSLAIALALQPTLENFFAGIQIIVDKPITVGQFIKLDSGESGYVHKIGWRSTWLRQLPNNVIVIPNKLLVTSRILNYCYPETEMSVLVQVGVHYDSDLENVEKVTIEVCEDILKKLDGGVPEFKPFIRYHTFNDFSIDFSVILRAKEFIDSYLIKHEFIKALHKRYREEGISIPYPIRTLDWNDNSGAIEVKSQK